MKKFSEFMKDKDSYEVGPYTFNKRNSKLYMEVPLDDKDEESKILDIVNNFFIDDNIRFCDVCGKPMQQGYMSDDGGYHSCEDCFDDDMNKSYGKGKWRATEEAGEYGGFYEAVNHHGEWEDTSIFYTEWY